MSSIAAELKIAETDKTDKTDKLMLNSNEELCIKHVCAREIPSDEDTIFPALMTGNTIWKT